MTTQEIINYYANLLILQYRGKPKAYATAQAVAGLVVRDQLPLLIQEAFTLGTAVGVQLDVIGKYAGVTRYGYSFSGPVTLNDTDFTNLIKIAIAQNAGGSSLADIQTLLSIFFPGTLQVYDHLGMRMSYRYDSVSGSNVLAEVFVKGGHLPKPMGVELAVLTYAPGATKFFGFRTRFNAAYNNTGFNTRVSGFVKGPWLNRSYGVA